MQQPVSRRDVYEPGLTATVGGRSVGVVSARVDRALPDPLVGGQLSAASASFTAVEGEDVTRTVATPWDPSTSWPPVPESPVSVSVDTGAGAVSLLEGGRVTSASGGTGDRSVTVEAADRYQSLDKTISWDELADAMPSESEATLARYVGLQSSALTDRILRHCGWFSTPPNPGYQALSVPAQGTLWPETGVVESALRASDGGGYPGWSNTPWGVGVIDTDAAFRLGGAYSIQSRGRVELTAMTATRPGEGTSRIDVLNSAGNLLVRMAWSETSGHLYLRDSSGGMTAHVSVPRADGMLYATVDYVSSTSAYVTIRSGGNTVGAAVTGIPQIVTTSVLTNARIVANALSGGFQVAFPSASGLLTDWTPNAVLYPRTANRNSLKAIPPVEGANCADLLAQQCEAECATYWIDETGVLRWWDLARLDARNSVATLTSDDDIAEGGFTWSHEMSQVKSRVSVKWKDPLREWSWRTAIDLWTGSGQTIQPNTATASDPAEAWINVPDDEIWIMPDLAFRRIADSGTVYNFNLGVGSYYGGVIAGGSTDEDLWVQSSDGSLLFSVERVTGKSFKSSTIWTGTKQAALRTPSEKVSSELWMVRRNNDLPVLRGKAKFTLVDRVTYSAQSGPDTAPEHEIDAGFWIQRPEQAQYTADYAGARLTVAQPVLSSVALIPFPGLQLGDVVEVQDTHVTRLTIRGIVVADSRSIDAGMGMDHAVTIRPTFITRNGVLWQQWGTVMNYAQYQTFAAEQSGNTWQEWAETPLLGKDVI